MCDARAMFKPMDLETIEEEDADILSLHSRNNLKNGNKRGANSRPHSQTNTITTYDTQHTDIFDANSLSYLNIGSVRNSLLRPGGVLSEIGGIRASNSKSADKWDRNYYYNNYDERDPVDLYLANNPKTYRGKQSRSRMANCLGWIWCGSSVRYFILLLSFLAISSLFANLQLFNLLALYAESDLLPNYLRHKTGVSSSPHYHPGVVNWSSSPPFGLTNGSFTSEEDGLASFNATYETGWMGSEQGIIDGGGKNLLESIEEAAVSTTQQTTTKSFLNRDLIGRFAQSVLFSIPGIAILIGHFPSVLLIRHFGCRKVMFGALMISASVVAAFPFLIGSDHFYIVLARSLLGLSFSPSFAFIGTNTLNWATNNGQLFFILIGFIAIQFGPVLSWASSVHLLTMDHKSRIRLFGLHSAASTLLAIIWLLFYRDSPQKCNFVNGEEMNRILKGKPPRNRRPQLPRSLCCMLLRSASSWACWISAFCYFFALLSLHIFLPMFTYKVLHNALNASLVIPFALLLIAHLFVQMLRPCFGASSTWKVRLFNSIAFLFSALLFLGITILPRDHLYDFRCALMLWLCLLPLGLCSAGFIQSVVVCGRFFAQHIVAHMQIAFGLAYFLVPTLIFLLFSESSIMHWRLLFLFNSLILLLGLAIFIILGRGTVNGWADQWAENAKDDDSLLMVKFTKTPSK